MTLEPPKEVREVADALITTFGENLTALLWHGSWARGEQTPESDHDLIVVVKRVDKDALMAMQEIFTGRSLWSTYVKTGAELRQYPATGRSQFHFAFVPLYGAIEAPPLTREGLIDDLRSFAASIQHECRYRIIHGSGREYSEADAPFIRRRNARWMYYQAKSAVMAMKARELVMGREYPANRAELRQRLTDQDELAIIDSVNRWHELRAGVEEDFVPIALLLDSFARGLVGDLDDAG